MNVLDCRIRNSLSNRLACVTIIAVGMMFCLLGIVPAMIAAQVSEQHRIESIERASKSFVGVFGAGGQGGGSGVVISADGFALTNYHVVEGNPPLMKCSMNDGVLYDAVIVGIDPVGDVALIQLLGRDDFPVAEIADSDSVRAGDECFAVGNPFLLATDFNPTVSWGIVSGVHRYQYPAGTLLEYADCIQTDAAINPGNSGGPLFDSDGKLIGINGRGSFEKRGRINVGVGYAISINQIKYFLSHLHSGRIVDHATLGATVATSDDGRILVSNVLESSEAFRRGLMVEDEIIRFAGRSIQTVNQFKNVLGIYPKGWIVPLVFRRGNVETEIQVRLMGVHDAEQLIEMVQGNSDAASEDVPENSPHETNPKNPTTNTESEFDHLFIAKRGFANFYFNQQQRQRIWNGCQQHGNLTQHATRWRITGQTGEGQPFELVLNDEKSGLKIGDATWVLDSNLDLASQLEGSESVGMLVGLHLWRKFLVGGPEKFGDVFYLGSVPDARSRQLTDVLIATADSIESQFLFDVENQSLIGMELNGGADTDSIEIEFSKPKRDGDLSLPSEIHFGQRGSSRSVINIRHFEFLAN